MSEEKSIKRDGLNLGLKEVEDKMLELSSLSPGLLEICGWKDKKVAEIEIFFRTEFHKPPKQAPDKFRLAEVRESTIEFGAHAGSRLDDIPFSYLEYLYEAQRELQERLKFYLSHPTIKRERDNG